MSADKLKPGDEGYVAPAADDLDLIDPGLEDEAKEDEELWDEIDAEETGEAADDSAAADTASDDEPAASDDAGDDDIWAGATDAQKAAFTAAENNNSNLQHQLDSEKGRTKTFRRQLSDVTGQLDRVAAKPPKKDDATDDGPTDDSHPESWDKLDSEYPEVAGPVGDRLDRIEANQKKIDKREEDEAADAKQEHLAAVTEQTRLLNTEHSDWLEVATNPEFEAWLDDQPREFRDAAAQNANEIVDASAAGRVIARYKASRSDQGDDDLGGPDDSQDTTDTSLADRRKRQLDSAKGPRHKGPGTVVKGIPEDGSDEEIWDGFDKEDARKEAQA